MSKQSIVILVITALILAIIINFPSNHISFSCGERCFSLEHSNGLPFVYYRAVGLDRYNFSPLNLAADATLAIAVLGVEGNLLSKKHRSKKK